MQGHILWNLSVIKSLRKGLRVGNVKISRISLQKLQNKVNKDPNIENALAVHLPSKK